MKSSLTSTGFVRRVASSPLTIAKSIGDVYGGLTQLEFLSKLVADGSVEPVVEAFKVGFYN